MQTMPQCVEPSYGTQPPEESLVNGQQSPSSIVLLLMCSLPLFYLGNCGALTPPPAAASTAASAPRRRDAADAGSAPTSLQAGETGAWEQRVDAMGRGSLGVHAERCSGEPWPR